MSALHHEIVSCLASSSFILLLGDAHSRVSLSVNKRKTKNSFVSSFEFSQRCQLFLTLSSS